MSKQPKAREEVLFRAEPHLMRLLRDCSQMHGRSIAAELRAAVHVHVTRGTLQALHRAPQDAPPGLTAPGVADDLAELEARVYGQPLPDHLLKRYADEAGQN